MAVITEKIWNVIRKLKTDQEKVKGFFFFFKLRVF